MVRSCLCRPFRHRDYFLPAGGGEEAHALPPPNRIALVSAGLLLVSLVAVVALAKALTPTLERRIAAVGAPRSVVGIVIAALVLLPKDWPPIVRQRRTACKPV